jgi:hypothetical protein
MAEEEEEEEEAAAAGEEADMASEREEGKGA